MSGSESKHRGAAPDTQDTESKTEARGPRSGRPLDREGYLDAIGPMGPMEDPDGFDRAMRSFDR